LVVITESAGKEAVLLPQEYIYFAQA